MGIVVDVTEIFTIRVMSMAKSRDINIFIKEQKVMKTTRRIFSMVLALMMVLSLSVTAFADTTTTATLNISVNGVQKASLHPAAGQSVYEYLNSVYTGTTISWSSFNDIYGKPAKNLDSLTIDGTPYANGAVDGSTTSVKVEKWGSIKGYGLVSVEKDGDTIVGYNYVYVGNSWVYSVKDSTGATVDVSDKYMNQYEIQSGDVISLEFKFVTSEWTSDEPILAAYPYC